jgi:hypothetical protein
MSIVEFLEARISEDQDHAEKHYASASSRGLGSYLIRVLDECAAKIQIIELHEAFGRASEPEARAMWHATGAVLKILANVYKDHRDYQQEWSA